MNTKLNQREALELFSGVSRFRILGMCLVLQQDVPCKESLNHYSTEQLLDWLDRHFYWNEYQWKKRLDMAA